MSHLKKDRVLLIPAPLNHITYVLPGTVWCIRDKRLIANFATLPAANPMWVHVLGNAAHWFYRKGVPKFVKMPLHLLGYDESCDQVNRMNPTEIDLSLTYVGEESLYEAGKQGNALYREFIRLKKDNETTGLAGNAIAIAISLSMRLNAGKHTEYGK